MREVEKKQYQISAQIRRRHHNRIFQVNRSWQEGTLNAFAFLPALLEDQRYEIIDQILDEITANFQNNQCTKDLQQSITTKYKYHNSTKTQLIMFKLMNRLQLWNDGHLVQALQLYRKGQQSMIKQLAIYLDWHKRKKQVSYKQKLKSIFREVFAKLECNEMYRFYWLEIVCEGIEGEDCPSQFINQLLQILQIAIEATDQFDLNRIIKIANKISSEETVSQKIAKSSLFPQLLTFLESSSLEALVEGLEMIAQMLSTSEEVIFILTQKLSILDFYAKFTSHIIEDVKVKVMWGISNIAGSLHWQEILKRDQIMKNLYQELSRKDISGIYLQQILFVYLNLFCSANQRGLLTLLDKYQGLQILLYTCNQVDYNKVYLQRIVYSIYSVCKNCPERIPHLQNKNLHTILLQLYQNQMDDRLLKMINTTLEAMQTKTEV